MQAWRRPYRVGVGRWIVAAWEAGALLFLYRTTVDLYHLPPRAATALALALVLCWGALCVRLTLMGLYLGGGGILIRGLLTRRTIAWQAIDGIIVERVSHRLLRVDVPAGRTVVIVLHDGTRVNSSLWANGVDFKFHPGRFREACAAIRREHQRTGRAAELSRP
jgi:hypothetical protein